MREEGIVIECVKAGKGNLFDCSLFCEMLATLLDVKI